MRLLTVLGTRPEIIRLSRIIPALDAGADRHVLVDTGQNHDPSLRDIFYRDLGVRAPDVTLGVRGATFTEQVAGILTGTEAVLRAERPDRVVILGDTNSGLAAFVACRMGIPVYHLEAGNRCYDERVPEEVNRRVIDHSSRVLLPYTERSRANLLREGIRGERILVTGNPIREVLDANAALIDGSEVHARLGVERGGYLLATTHRQENVDDPARLADLADALARMAADQGLPLIWSVHPRTRSRLEASGVVTDRPNLRVTEPLGFGDFVALERDARCVLSDSGTVAEETCILRVPNVTLRDVTERPETVECGSAILAGVRPDRVARAVSLALSRPADWTPPREYLERHVSAAVAGIVLGADPLP
jgi:UDP-N-acetylglucosamine 2-epimerase (non-hydrolysing)